MYWGALIASCTIAQILSLYFLTFPLDRKMNYQVVDPCILDFLEYWRSVERILSFFLLIQMLLDMMQFGRSIMNLWIQCQNLWVWVIRFFLHLQFVMYCLKSSSKMKYESNPWELWAMTVILLSKESSLVIQWTILWNLLLRISKVHQCLMLLRKQDLECEPIYAVVVHSELDFNGHK